MCVIQDLRVIIGLSSFIVNGYKVIPFSNTAYQNMFSLMETTGDGILFHCGGGKDRTGIFAALVLSLFGCDKQTIFDDYLKSNESVKNHLMPKLLQSDYPQPVKDTLMYVCSVHTELLESSFEAILQKYDSLEEYFDTEYKLNRDLLFKKYVI
ncbi:tyrosine-protein phosphatase [Holdemanella porci]|uniref:tyrosine-protein phosphatase n=1 Tax=Holdemanella porci TaxID=2652276 RepID=UPI003AEFDDBD